MSVRVCFVFLFDFFYENINFDFTNNNTLFTD